MRITHVTFNFSLRYKRCNRVNNHNINRITTNQCLNNLKQMGLAIMNYESSKKAYPRGRWNIDPNDSTKHAVADRTATKSKTPKP